MIDPNKLKAARRALAGKPRVRKANRSFYLRKRVRPAEFVRAAREKP